MIDGLNNIIKLEDPVGKIIKVGHLRMVLKCVKPEVYIGVIEYYI